MNKDYIVLAAAAAALLGAVTISSCRDRDYSDTSIKDDRIRYSTRIGSDRFNLDIDLGSIFKNSRDNSKNHGYRPPTGNYGNECSGKRRVKSRSRR